MAEQRYQAVLAVIADGLSVTQAAEKTGVSRQTLHRGWRAMRPVGWRAGRWLASAAFVSASDAGAG